MINVRIRNGLCPDTTTGDGGATEGDIRGSFSDIIEIVGVKDLVAGDCLVTQNSPTAMSVLVAPGIVYIPNILYNKLDSNTVKFWEAIVTVSTPVVITANTSGSTRIDLICAKMDIAIIPDEHASNISTLVAVAGTPGAGVPATPNNHYKLAEITVANGALTIITANITDRRTQSKIDFDFLPKATGATINTGISDTEIVTPAAIKDSYLSNSYNSLYRQALINGNFDVFQRGISFNNVGAGKYTADRWYFDSIGATYTVTRQDGTGVTGSQYCLRTARNAASTATDAMVLRQALETSNSIKFRGKKLTLSFWARAGANYSATSSVLTAQIRSGIGSDAAPNFTGDNDATSNLTLTTTWTKFTVTTADVIGATKNQVGVVLYGVPTGTAGAADYFEIAQVQLCAGDVALPFMPKSFDDELRACKRYCHVINTISIVETIAQGSARSTTVAQILLPLPIEMRVSPILTATAGDYQLYDGITAATVVTGIVKDDALTTGETMFGIKVTTASGLTQFRPYYLTTVASARVMVLDSEL